MSTAQLAERAAPVHRRPLSAEILSWPGTRALMAVVALFAISPLFATGSVGRIALVSMLPFAALTAIVAVGQTLVIQQGGLDLSIPGAVTLAALIVAKFGHDGSWGLPTAVVVAVAGTSLFGVLSGLVISVFRLPPLVVTIASQALLVGMVQAVSGGFGAQVTKELSTFALSKWAGIPVLTWFALVLVLAVHVTLKLTRLGRKFELVGENPASARNIGIPTTPYVVSAYWMASLLAAIAGVMLAGLLRSPTLTAGDNYLLPSIAAVVLGGTALTGGRGSVIGTALGALFLAQLSQLVATFTQATAVQNIVQALIIGVGIVTQLQLGGASSRLKGLLGGKQHHVQPTQDS